VVFLHGLSLSEESWWRVAGGRRPARSYGDRLGRDLGLTPVYVRYNTGLRISDNGRALSRLLDELTASWPVPVRSIALVGHSMGGLLARSACHCGNIDGAAWVPAVGTVVTLGTPHLGAPLEKGVHVTDWLLSRLPETAPLARPLQARSAGVRDLRLGSVAEEDAEVPFLDHATYYFVAAVVSRDPEHPAGRLLGDGLVRYPSASGQGRTRRVPFEIGNGARLCGVGHLALVNHPAVYRRLRAWLARG
jgi:pimeloyl-ACP methyl ester carboxylesterase